MTKRTLLAIALWVLAGGLASRAQDTRYPPQGSQIPGPEEPQDFATWLADVQHWRRERLIRIGYNGAEYERPELRWTQRSFVEPQSMVEDRYFYDAATQRYTVERFLTDLEKRYGGIDSVLLWHVYPNIGIDNRNQYDLLRDLPGGLAGVREMVEDFHRHGVRVLFPVMVWDQGTRDEGVPNWTATARLLAEVDADGVNGDTLDAVPRAFRLASDATHHPLALESEHLTLDEPLAWNNLSWGYWKYSFVPSVSKPKWLETRHMPHICNRWARDKTDDLQSAFFNGIGYESWENVWGIWNQITPRDAEALRRLATVERHVADLLTSPGWEPHTSTLRAGVFASKFPGATRTVWTLVNRNEYDVDGAELELAHFEGARYFDLWHGTELTARLHGGRAVLSFPLEAHGFGAVLAVTGEPSEDLKKLLAHMQELSRKPLADYSHEWRFLPQQLVEIPRTELVRTAPPGMVLIPGADVDFQVSGIEIEGHNDVGVDVQYPWEDSPRRYHRHTISIKPFYIDRTPVTNTEFKKFVETTQYHPADDHNFLRDWKDGTYPAGWDLKPVTWISLEDARAYAAWARKRLPHEWEWQYAAQGLDGRLYPWGNEWDPSAVSVPNKGRTLLPPDDVNSHMKGASPFGVLDLVGNVWQWTDEFVDEHTRAAIVRGGSSYQPQGSMWYFPQAYKLNEHGKYLLMAPSKDRAGTLGFRCVVDAE